MLKKLSFLFIGIGVFLIGLGAYEYMNTKKVQEESLIEAYQLLQQQDSKDAHSIMYTPDVGEEVGVLEIPKIGRYLPIVEGTDEDELEKGVGHYKNSAYPSQNDQIVLSGHRDTIFRRMGELEISDELILHLPYGSFTYSIEHTQIVKADDLTIIKSTAPKEELVLTTCYPFSYIGNAPDRYIITAYPTKEKNSVFKTKF